MILGSIKQANRIISLLYEHNLLDIEVYREDMYFAWATSHEWPPFILDPNPDKLPFSRFEERQRLVDSPEYMQHMEWTAQGHWDVFLMEKYPNVDETDLNELVSSMYAGKDGLPPRPSLQMKLLGMAIHMAIFLNYESQARELLSKAVEKWLASLAKRYEYQLRGFATGRHVWTLLVDRFVPDEVGISEEAIVVYVDSVIEILSMRLANGPERALNKTVPELVHMLNQLYLDIRPLHKDSSTRINHIYNYSQGMPETFTHPGLTVDEVAETEARLHTKFPGDFKEFLMCTNGFYFQDDGSQCPHNLLMDAASMKVDDWLNEIGPGLPLISEDLPFELSELFKWKKVEGAIQTGFGGEESQQVIVGPESVSRAIKEFDRVYNKADTETQAILERLAKDHFGGIQGLRELKWVVCTLFPWNRKFRVFRYVHIPRYPLTSLAAKSIFRSFTYFLEYLVLEAQDRLDKLKNKIDDHNGSDYEEGSTDSDEDDATDTDDDQEGEDEGSDEDKAYQDDARVKFHEE